MLLIILYGEVNMPKKIKIPPNLPSVLRDYLSQTGKTQRGFGLECKLSENSIRRVCSGKDIVMLDSTINSIMFHIGPGWAADVKSERISPYGNVMELYDKLSPSLRRMVIVWMEGLLEKQRDVDRANTELEIVKRLGPIGD